MGTIKDIFKESHRRFNILTGEWVHVSPHRMHRPWQGALEKVEQDHLSELDENCYLCPGNSRTNGIVNPNYSSTYVFTNDFAAIKSDLIDREYDEGLLRAKSERGVCRVVCFSPRHDLTIPELTEEEVSYIVKTWINECHELSELRYINHIQIFENKGQAMGCSNPHPHGQIWAQENVPVEPDKKQAQQYLYYLRNRRSLLGDYLEEELECEDRVVFQNESFCVVVPFWAVWPFEVMIVPKRKMARIIEMTREETMALAAAYRQLTILYDNLFETSFPYSAGIHQAMYDGKEHPEWHWHMVFYPPLLRSAAIKKFMVGYEMLANPQRDITPEYAVEALRNASDIHYKKKKSEVLVDKLFHSQYGKF